ncbi:uncharacterized protein BO88DRAFT_42613 [Aspergillus vadensis CBS 113365]|uniref:Uncharacterized protein n=1 Tax=Aspergillus vadensis (strain CBS 113365 / IMI 142717 / IBT 24658) TaxID=1448311 RepID=A0A319C0Z4_ASPVC|nr:hypothetical protein BO88DRAFT_42613 [Aspergillus vadensis CBS 113365]PYH69128.1 hypothetical protein BO88DRAFT_42613 [Aspergillus vadensis CBS 113365]
MLISPPFFAVLSFACRRQFNPSGVPKREICCPSIRARVLYSTWGGNLAAARWGPGCLNTRSRLAPNAFHHPPCRDHPFQCRHAGRVTQPFLPIQFAVGICPRTGFPFSVLSCGNRQLAHAQYVSWLMLIKLAVAGLPALLIIISTVVAPLINLYRCLVVMIRNQLLSLLNEFTTTA